MDVREKLVELQLKADIEDETSENTTQHREYIADLMIDNGVTVQEWISVKDRTPKEADGTVWVCLADVFPYNDKEPYIARTNCTKHSDWKNRKNKKVIRKL